MILNDSVSLCSGVRLGEFWEGKHYHFFCFMFWDLLLLYACTQEEKCICGLLFEGRHIQLIVALVLYGCQHPILEGINKLRFQCIL